MAPLDSTIFESLVRDHHVAVYRSAWRVLRSEADAEDVAQEVFLRVLAGKLDLGQAREPRAVLVWAAARAALSRGRSDSARHAREERHAMENIRKSDAPEQAAEDAERHALVYDAIRALPDPQQAALILRFQEELTYAAIGNALGISEPSALERVKKALASLEQRLTRVGFAGAMPFALECGGEGLSSLLAEAAPTPRGGLAESLARLSGPTATGLATSGSAGSFSLVSLLLPALVLLASAVIAIPLVLWENNEKGQAPDVAAASRPDTPSIRNPNRQPGEDGILARAVARIVSPNVPQGSEPNASSGAASDQAALVGILVRDSNGAPVADAKVTAFIRAPGLKFPSENVQIHTDSRGFAQMELPIDSLDDRLRDQTWAILVHHPAAPRVSMTLQDLTAGEKRTLEVSLQANAAEAAFEIDVLVVDQDGPLPGAEVALGHQASRSGQSDEYRAESESALTGPDGRVTLRGSWLGTKLVVVDARAMGRSHVTAELQVDSPGVYTLRVECESAWEVAGALRAVDGSSVAGLQLSLFQTRDNWRWPYMPLWWSTPATTEVKEDGRFRLFGLPSQPSTFLWLGLASSRAAPWSPFSLRIDSPNPALDVAVKREQDPRDIGQHLAEVHGHFSGLELPSGPERWVRVVPIPDGVVGEALERDFVQAALLGDYDLDRPRQQIAAQSLMSLQAQQGIRPQQAQMEAQQVDAPPPGAQLEFHRTGLEPGRILLVSRVYGYAPSVLGPLILGDHDIHSDLTIKLEPGNSIDGVLSDTEGSPTQGALVTLAGFGPRSQGRLERLDQWHMQHPAAADFGLLSARTDRFGHFTLSHVPAGMPFRLAAVHPDHTPTLFDMGTGSERDQDGRIRFLMAAKPMR